MTQSVAPVLVGRNKTMGKALDEYLIQLNTAIDNEDNGIGKAIHKELRYLAEAIKSDLESTKEPSNE